MKQFIYILMLALSGILAVSCSITNAVHFNSDYSGEYSAIIDMKDIFQMAAEMDTTESDWTESWTTDMNVDETDSIGDILEAIEGVDNVRFDASDPGVMVVSFNFADIDALNAGVAQFNNAFKDSQRNATENEELDLGIEAPAFDQEQTYSAGKKSLSFVASNPLSGVSGDDEAEVDLGMEDMMEFFSYYFEFTFDKKIKSAEYQGVTLVKQDDHMLKTKMDASMLKSPTDVISIDVVLK